MINGPRIVQYNLIVYQPMYGYTLVDKIKVVALKLHMYHYATIFYERILCLFKKKIILQE